MDIWEANRLVLFIAFVIPGFVSLKTYQLIQPGAYEGTSERLTDAVAYSCINYAILFWPIVAVEQSELIASSQALYYLFYVVVLFIAPIAWAVGWRFLRTREFFQRNAPHPTSKPWDYFFGQRKSYWVKATLKDGTVVVGLYGHNSFAFSAPADEQIYLEETWLLGENGAFLRKKSDTAGVLILGSELSHIEFRS